MSRRTLAILALLTTVSIWGTTFVATKIALREMQPLTLTLVRFVLASAILIPIAVVEHRRRGGRLIWRQLALSGFLGGFLYFACQNVGLAFTSATKASLILGSVPALTALLSILVLKERVTTGRAVGIAASVLGVSVIVFGGGAANFDDGSLLGDVLIAGSAISWAVYTVQVKDLEGSVGPAVLSAASAGFGAIFMLPLVGAELATQPPPTLPGLSGWLSIGYLGFIASAVTFLFWNYALSQVDASEAAVYINLVPAIAVASAVVVLSESVTAAHVAGGALVLLGVWAAGRQPVRQQRADSQAGG